MTKEAESLQKKVSDMARLLKDKDEKVRGFKQFLNITVVHLLIY